jgi:ABC-type glycerol-3-phosphate transport system permease component
MLVIYCLMALALVRLRWHDRGVVSVLVTIIIAGFFWSVPTLLVGDVKIGGVLACSLWLGNWLVSGFGVVLLCQAVRLIPSRLEDSARLDGLGWFGTFYHVVLPLVRFELGLAALLTLLGTSGLCWTAMNTRGGPPDFSSPWFHWLSPISGPTPLKFLGEMIAGSLVMTFPVILIFFFAKRYFTRAASI